MTPTNARLALMAAVGIFTTVSAAQVRAADASAWDTNEFAKVRLLAGSRASTVVMGGVAIHLTPGWKTYWRYAGDSGIAPEIDFSNSDNVDQVTVLWPAPTAFDDGAGGTSYGYQSDVVLPLRITAKQAGKPLVLRAKIEYAVCKHICVPLEASSELTFNSLASTEDGTLVAALDTLPKPASIGDPNPYTIREVRRDGSKVIVDVAAPAGENAHLFVEGPTSDWALPVPTRVKPPSGDSLRFTFELAGVPTDTNLDGKLLKYTLTGGNRAYEFNIAVPAQPE